MEPHNLATITRPRTLAHVLLDLKEARRDWEQASNEADAAPHFSKEEEEAGDRMAEADQRIDALRAEFAQRFFAVTGLTWKQIEAAISEAAL
jgi:hypothetical protein